MIIVYLRHSVPLMQAFDTSSITCPLGQTHCGKSHIIGGLGLLQVAFIPKQSAVWICPFIEHSASKNKHIHEISGIITDSYLSQFNNICMYLKPLLYSLHNSTSRWSCQTGIIVIIVYACS